MFNRTVATGAIHVGALTDAELEAELERLEVVEAAEAAVAAEEREAEAAARARSERHDSRAPPSFLDPISRELMRDPVMVDCGQVYDRASIEAWFGQQGQPDGVPPKDPLTGVALGSTELRPVHALRNAIEEWIEMQPAAAAHAAAGSADSVDGDGADASDGDSALTAGDGVASPPSRRRGKARRWRSGLDADAQTQQPELLPRSAALVAPPTALATESARRKHLVRQQQHHDRQQQLRTLRAQRRELRRRGSATYRFRAAAGRVATSQQSVGLTVVVIVAGMFMGMVEYSNQKWPGAGASTWSEGSECELRAARVECQLFGKAAAEDTVAFSMDSERERCRSAFTIAQRSRQLVGEEWVATVAETQAQAYRYPTAVYIDTAMEASDFVSEVIEAANARAGGTSGSDAWVNSSVPCRCGTLLTTQRCGHCECSERCVDGQCQCVCPQPVEDGSGEGSDYTCGCSGPSDDSWTPCLDGHCQLGSGEVGTDWAAVYQTALTGTARVGLLVSSLAVVWAGFSCCAFSALLLDRQAAAQMPVATAAAVAAGQEGDKDDDGDDDECEEGGAGAPQSQETAGVFRADLAAAVCGADDVAVVVDDDDTAGDHKAVETAAGLATATATTTGGGLATSASAGVSSSAAASNLSLPPLRQACDCGCVRRQPESDTEYSAPSCCCCSALTYTVGITGAICAQTGGGRWDWLAYGMLIAVGFVAVAMTAFRLSWRLSSS
jgi:hypothetical protein